MAEFKDYFNEKFKQYTYFENEQVKIDELFFDKDMYLISGDFYGIQKFIFEGLSTKNAAKVLRAKSAFVQLFISVLSKYICEKFGIDEKNILTINAGKFEILVTADKFDKNIIEDIQKTINEYCIKNFYGLSGINICYVYCKKDDFNKPENYKKLRKNIANEIEKKKFKKFDLQNQNSVLSYDENITNQTLCKTCNIRKIKDEKAKEPCCNICDIFIKLGKKLVSDEKVISSKKDLGIEFCDDIKLDLTEKIKSYVPKIDTEEEKNKILDFDYFSKNSEGTEAIAVLKADVDGMGNFIKNSDVTDSFENFDLFSKTLDNFFSLYIPKQMEEEFKNTYTVFAGGDDLFLLGSWNVILELARFIKEEFKEFVKDKKTEKLTISFGIAMAKPSKPISYLASETEALLEKSKEYKENEGDKIIHQKDAITFFGETVKWDNYNKVFKELESAFKLFEDKDINTAFLYRLLEFCEMSKKVKYDNDTLSTIWKSKLRYSFTRNNDNLGENIYKILDENIEKNPEETKMFLNEFIYKRRD